MKTTKITIRNLFGIRETTLDGKSVEISGPKGSGKTSVLDAIRYALTNRSDRDYIVHKGADEGEIIIETNTGLSIDRKALPAKSAGTVKVRDGSMLQTRPAEFLAQIFTPLQLDPVKFTQLSRQEKNREILNLIEFQWDMNWIKEQFGEIPQGVDYGQHILEVLNDIQAENGIYFQSRQNKQRRDLYDFASAVDTKDPDLGNASGKAIGFRYMDLDADCADLGAELQAAFLRMKPFLDTWLQMKGVGDFRSETFDIQFNMDMPVDETEIIANINSSASLLSKRTLLENHPWVKDVDAELAAIKKQREQEMKDYGKDLFSDDDDGGDTAK